MPPTNQNMTEDAQRTPPGTVFRFTSVPTNATPLPIPPAPQQQQQQQPMDEENAPLEPKPSAEAAPPPSKRKSFAMRTMSVSPPPTSPPTQLDSCPRAIVFPAAAATGQQVVEEDSPPAAQRRRSATASGNKEAGQDRSIQVSCSVGEVMRIPLSGKTVPFRVVKRRGRGFSSVVFECEEDAPEAGAAPRVVTVKVLSGGKSGMGACLHEVETLAFLKVKREEAGLTRERSRFAELASWFYRRSSVGGVDHVCLVFRGGGLSLWEAMAARSPPSLGTAVVHGRTEISLPSSASLKWGVREVVEVARGLLEGIAFLHSVGLIHADIKPDNVALYPPSSAQSSSSPSPSSSSSSPNAASTVQALPATVAKQATAPVPPFDLRLIDLGNAVFAADTVPGVTAGTPSYLAPEARKGLTWGPPVDVWAVGCVLYEIVTGMRVGSGSGVGTLGLTGSGGIRNGGHSGGLGGGAFSGGGGTGAGEFTGVMAGVVGLVERLLTEDVGRRPSAEDALKDAIFSQL
ncbi:unnamed protein product [Scytosiphon promiscuus]